MTSNPGAKGLVLLVEDDSLVRSSIRDNLELRGYTCVEAAHGGIGLEMLQKHNPDVVISDISMPVMGGIEFVVKCRALGCQTPIILLTGVHDSNVRTLGQDVGAFECISKPPDYDKLDRMLQLMLSLGSPPAN